MKYRKFFWVMVPLISLAGLVYPALGLAMPFMMATLLTLSYFKGRYWCGSLCPRGSFFDYLIRPISFNRGVPRLLKKRWFAVGFLILFMSLFSYRTYSVFVSYAGWPALLRWGYVFSMLCLVTSIIGIVLGVVFFPRTWCVFCPMGTLQTGVHSIGRRLAKAAPREKGE